MTGEAPNERCDAAYEFAYVLRNANIETPTLAQALTSESLRLELQYCSSSFVWCNGCVMSLQSSLVGLNVGGRIFVTSRATLTRDPDSMLALMLTQGLPAASQDKDGNLVIDRDGDTFKYILNFLRDGSCVYPLDFHRRAELLREANYFQV